MPTRNRARLLPLSLRSALDLRGDDYEVVVSDNCSEDETREVVDGLGDSRVRYVRTPKLVPVSENMEFVLERARGEFVTFLCDDDALVAGVLESAREILAVTRAELLAWPICSYFYKDWYDLRHRNTLVVRPYSGRIDEVQARDTLIALYRDIEWGRIPFLMNSVCSRTLIERVQRRVPRLCPPVLLTEVFAGVALLAEVGTYCWLDTPLTIFGRWSRSLGSSLAVRRWEAGPAYLQQFPKEATFDTVPLRMPTATNMFAESLLQAKGALGGELAGLELNWERYFVRVFRELVYQRTQGADVTEDLKSLRAALTMHREPMRHVTTAAIEQLDREYRYSWRLAARRLVNQVPLLGWLESALRPPMKSEEGGLIVRGREVGFSNILECARAWGRLLVEDRAQIAPLSAGRDPQEAEGAKGMLRDDPRPGS
jgi:hypothetical protein